ncbi:MAG: FtsH protease activity modulator HflK [Alphaproteobacteria bacterium]|nr:FtsH protease activity modulator HflK [Alphaproteobacteria bacterium]
MPWSNRGGPSSGGNGGGPWGSPGGGRGPQPPNLEDLLRQGQDRVRRLIPTSAGGGRGLVLFVLVILAVWGASGFYRVEPDQQGVVLRFGKFVKTTSPGLHYHLPTPFESVLTPRVTLIFREDIGFREADATARVGARFIPEEALMLTGDENIIEVHLSVQWRIINAGDFLFNNDRPQVTVKSAAESAIREVIGHTPLLRVNETRGDIESETRQRLQSTLDSYGAGIQIIQISLRKGEPPAAVIDAYNDVQRARADLERQINEAQAYRNDIIPRARGEAAQIIQAAEAYKQQVVANSDGTAQRFLAVYREYTQAKDVTVRRLYLETMEQVLKAATKVIVDQNGKQGVVPYLPLPEVQRRAQGG